jgi:hypothetical protein
MVTTWRMIFSNIKILLNIFCFVILELSYSNLSSSAVTISWKNVSRIQETDHITYVLLGREKEKRDLKQV